MAAANGADVEVKLLEERFRELTVLLYDTNIPPDRLEREVMPFVHPNVRFIDPWQTEGGRENYRVGLSGFHAMFRFHFELKQVSVRLDADGKGGRALVDGVMHLRQLAPLLTYPLRTILRYDFVLSGREGAEFLITEHEEMWSFGDMLEAMPLAGRFYRSVFRPAFAQGFLLASRIASRLRFGQAP